MNQTKTGIRKRHGSDEDRISKRRESDEDRDKEEA